MVLVINVTDLKLPAVDNGYHVLKFELQFHTALLDFILLDEKIFRLTATWTAVDYSDSQIHLLCLKQTQKTLKGIKTAIEIKSKPESWSVYFSYTILI